MTDKAARAALLTAKGMDNKSENIADYVADLLRQGRAKEITDDLMAQADPQRLMHHYKSGNTGMGLPMDQASRMARAKQMGFGNTKWNHATALDDDEIHQFKGDNVWLSEANKRGVFHSNDFAKMKAGNTRSPSIFPVYVRGPENRKDWEQHVKDVAEDVGADPEGMQWNEAQHFVFGDSPSEVQAPKSGVDVYENYPDMDQGRHVINSGIAHPTNIRSQFARFDPRLDHLAHLSASTGGAMEYARHVEAVNRAGGQIAPSKYLPDVPRQVHAGGGKVAFQQGNHPDVPDVLYHGNAPKIATKGWTDEADQEATNKNIAAQDFHTFKPSEYGNFGSGVYLSDSPNVASNFAQGIRGENTEAKPYGQVFKLHVSMKNPFTDSVLRHREWKDYIKAEIKKALWLNPGSSESPVAADLISKLDNDTATVRDLFLHDTPDGTMVSHLGRDKIHQMIRNSGFDGIIAHRHDGSKEIVAFKPEQVKSATGNQGTFDPNDPDITKSGGGRIHANGGGVMDLRSKAAEVISGLKGEKGLAEDMIRAAKNAGVKDVEIANANPPSGKISRDELARHFENAVPKVQVKRIGDAEKAAELKKQHSGQRDIEGMTDDEIDGMMDHVLGVHEPLYEQYQLPYGKNYREHILSLPDDRGEKNFYSTHWDSPNVLAHVRLSDRYKGETQKNIEPIIGKLAQYFETSLDYLGSGSADHAVKKGVISPDEAATVSRFMRWKNGYETQKGVGRKILHVEELQSDWNNTARKQGLKTGREKQEYDDYVAGMRQKMIDKVTRPQAPVFDPETGEDRLPIPQDVIDKKVEKYQKMHPSDLAANLGVSAEHRQMDLARYKGVYPAPYIDPDSRDVENLALKHVLTEAAKGGYDGITFTPGSEQSARWGNTDFGDIYDRILPNMTTKLARQHDKTITPDVMGLPGARGNTVSAQLIPLTETARQSILKNGFGAFKRGGTVGKEEGGATGSLREKALWPSAQAIKAGTGSREAHAEMVNKIKPVSPYAAPVPPASDQQVHDALTKDKQPKAFAPRGLAEGTPVAVRLDIPAYEKRNTWVVSVHHPKTDFTAGEIIGYDSVAHIGNPRFGVHPTGALNIASGKPKSTIATVHGNWKKTTPEDAFKLSQTIHNDPQWRQVGMDPERHSYFYDRETQEPVMAADEALHVGPLVYAKNPVYGKKTDFAFSSGGDVSSALALTRRFSKDGKAATMALKSKGK